MRNLTGVPKNPLGDCNSLMSLALLHSIYQQKNDHMTFQSEGKIQLPKNIIT